jgi:hypothetical protein
MIAADHRDHHYGTVCTGILALPLAAADMSRVPCQVGPAEIRRDGVADCRGRRAGEI